MATTGTGPWITFFKDAGLPASVAATYALTFTENRIRMDMLLDLTKEILKDMGINLMGDVIAILRHARRVHEQTAREKVLAGSPSAAVQPSSSVIRSSAVVVPDRISPTQSSDSRESSPIIIIGDTSPKPRTSPASRIVQHYTNQLELPEKNMTQTVTKANVVKPTVKIVKKKLKTRTVATQDSEDLPTPPPLKKVRRVLPEHEGGYKITMPSGSTPRTQKILAKQGLLPAKKTVFDRLGDGSVSSTTGSDGPLITITGLGNNIIKNNSDKASSVFSRLGEKPQVTSSTPVTAIKIEPEDSEATQYAGVLKQVPRKSILVKRADTVQKTQGGTMRADAESSPAVKKKVSLQNRLGTNKVKTGILRTSSGILKQVKVIKKVKSKATAGILANPTNATKVSVKQRLGGSSPEIAEGITTSQIVKTKPKPITFNTPSSTVTSHPPGTKTVTFGTITEKTYIREPTIHPRISISNRPPSVFRRLGSSQ